MIENLFRLYMIENLFRLYMIENLFRLYIEPEVLLKSRIHDSLHNAIYKDGRELLRSDSELLLIE